MFSKAIHLKIFCVKMLQSIESSPKRKLIYSPRRIYVLVHTNLILSLHELIQVAKIMTRLQERRQLLIKHFSLTQIFIDTCSLFTFFTE